MIAFEKRYTDRGRTAMPASRLVHLVSTVKNIDDLPGGVYCPQSSSAVGASASTGG